MMAVFAVYLAAVAVTDREWFEQLRLATSTAGVTVGWEARLWRMADALRGSMDAAEHHPPRSALRLSCERGEPPV
jgi:hypothetical protein